MVSMTFVFVEMLEFALVLVLKEQKLGERSHDKDKPEPIKIVSKQPMEIQNVKGKVSNGDLNITDVTESRQTKFWINKPKFFEKLPVTRKIDFSAFIIYHFAYLLFNIIYWV